MNRGVSEGVKDGAPVLLRLTAGNQRRKIKGVA
jgi:hypothetical protein